MYKKTRKKKSKQKGDGALWKSATAETRSLECDVGVSVNVYTVGKRKWTSVEKQLKEKSLLSRVSTR